MDCGGSCYPQAESVGSRDLFSLSGLHTFTTGAKQGNAVCYAFLPWNRKGGVYMVGTDTSGGGESINLGAEPSKGEDTGQRGRRERGTMLAHVT